MPLLKINNVLQIYITIKQHLFKDKKFIAWTVFTMFLLGHAVHWNEKNELFVN